MTLDALLAVFRSAGFRHAVPKTSDATQVKDGYQLGASDAYRMWHPLLRGSAYVGDDAAIGLHVDATAEIGSHCFPTVLGVRASGDSNLPGGDPAPRWTAQQLDKLVARMSRLLPDR
jgi:hypothetical protein